MPTGGVVGGAVVGGGGNDIGLQATETISERRLVAIVVFTLHYFLSLTVFGYHSSQQNTTGYQQDTGCIQDTY